MAASMEHIEANHVTMMQFIKKSQAQKLLDSREFLSELYKMIGFKLLARDIKKEDDVELLEGYVIILLKHDVVYPKYGISKKLWEHGLDHFLKSNN